MGFHSCRQATRAEKLAAEFLGGQNEERTYPPTPKSSGDLYASETKVIVYDFDLYNLWKHKSDEEFLDDFTVEVIKHFSGHLLVRQLLHLVEAKHLLRDIPGRALCLANKKAWPDKKSFINLSPVRKQIKQRLTKEIQVFSEYEAVKERHKMQRNVTNETEQDI